MKTVESAGCVLILIFSACAMKYSIPEYVGVGNADLHPVVISNLVGDTIDSGEQKEYELFPGVKNNDFVSATVYNIGKDDPEYRNGYVVEIRIADGNKYVSLNRDPKGIALLRDYLDNYETNKADREKLKRNRKILRYIRDTIPVYEKVNNPFEAKWHIVGYDDGLGLPITWEEIKLFNTKKTNAYIYSAGVCAISCCIVGVAWGGTSYNASWGGDDFSGTVLLVGIPGVLLSTAAGYTMGNVMDKRETIKAIKAGRQLRPVE